MYYYANNKIYSFLIDLNKRKMKKLIYISLCLLSILSFAQQTYKVTEGELQFVSFKKGIIIKKADGFYRLEPKEYNEEKFQLTKLEPSELEKL